MPYSEIVSVEVEARNTLVRHRDMMKEKYGVDVFFPRSEVRGAFQGMVMKGTVNSVFKAKQDVSRVLAAWKEEYEAYRARKKERQRLHRETKNVEEVYWPEVGESKGASNPAKKMRNVFSALLDDDGDAVDVPEMAIAKVPVPAMKSWAAMAAKAPMVKKLNVNDSGLDDLEVEDKNEHARTLTMGDVMQVNVKEERWFAWGEMGEDSGDEDR